MYVGLALALLMMQIVILGMLFTLLRRGDAVDVDVAAGTCSAPPLASLEEERRELHALINTAAKLVSSLQTGGV